MSLKQEGETQNKSIPQGNEEPVMGAQGAEAFGVKQEEVTAQKKGNYTRLAHLLERGFNVHISPEGIDVEKPCDEKGPIPTSLGVTRK